MKRNPRKLTLTRETLHQLEQTHLQNVAAGNGSARICPNYPDTGGGSDTGPVYTGPLYATCPSYGNYCTVSCGSC